MKGLFSINRKEEKKERTLIKKIKEDTMVTKEYDEEKLDMMLSDLEYKLKTLFENDKDLLAEIINGVTGIPKEDIIERGIIVDSQDLIDKEKIKQYKDSDILISIYNNTINIVINQKYRQNLK